MGECLDQFTKKQRTRQSTLAAENRQSNKNRAFYEQLPIMKTPPDDNAKVIKKSERLLGLFWDRIGEQISQKCTLDLLWSGFNRVETQTARPSHQGAKQKWRAEKYLGLSENKKRKMTSRHFHTVRIRCWNWRTSNRVLSTYMGIPQKKKGKRKSRRRLAGNSYIEASSLWTEQTELDAPGAHFLARRPPMENWGNAHTLNKFTFSD